MKMDATSHAVDWQMCGHGKKPNDTLASADES